jgi:hypothetical protein
MSSTSFHSLASEMYPNLRVRRNEINLTIPMKMGFETMARYTVHKSRD